MTRDDYAREAKRACHICRKVAILEPHQTREDLPQIKHIVDGILERGRQWESYIDHTIEVCSDCKAELALNSIRAGRTRTVSGGGPPRRKPYTLMSADGEA